MIQFDGTHFDLRSHGLAHRRWRLAYLSLCLLAGQGVTAATITVNSVADTIATNGSVTLREAITSINDGADVNSDIAAARSGNAYGSSDAIHFSIATGQQTLVIQHELPAVLKAATIDGTTQPGYSGSPLISLDGATAPGSAGGLLLSSLVPTTLLALNVANFPGEGVRIGTNVDRIFANGFETIAAGAARLSDSPSQASAVSLALNNVAIGGCGSTGLEIDDANVSVSAQNLAAVNNGAGGVLVSAGHLTVAGHSQVAGNLGGTPVAYGTQVAPGAALTLSGTNGDPILINGNDGIGLLVRGTLSATQLQVTGSQEQGVVVDTINDPLFPGGGSNVQDIVVAANQGGGLLVSAGRLNVSGASQINNNSGGSPVPYGAQVAPGAVLTLTGANGTPIQLDANIGTGLLVRGNFSGTYVEAAFNGAQGVVVDTIDEPIFPEGGSPTSNVVLAAFDIHNSGGVPGVMPPGGLTVLRTRPATTSMTTNASGIYVPERFVLKEGPAISTQSRAHDNQGDGITLGGAASGLCASLPAGMACGAVDGTVRNTVVYGNQEGIVIQQQDANDLATVPNLLYNDVTENTGVGLHVRTSLVGFDANGLYINGNIIGHNGWPSPTCDSAVAETASQVWFDGPVAAPASLTSACAANATAAACNADRNHTCLWNQAIADAQLPDPCRPSYLLSTNNCSSNANVISGYKGVGNPDLVVGVLAFNGAWVNGINVSWKHAGNLLEGQDWYAGGVTSFFSDGASGSEMVCSAAVSACPVHF